MHLWSERLEKAATAIDREAAKAKPDVANIRAIVKNVEDDPTILFFVTGFDHVKKPE